MIFLFFTKQMTSNQFTFFENAASLVNEDWLKISIPMRAEKFLAVHEMEEIKKDAKTDLVNNFINFKLDLFAGFLSICFLCLFLKFLIVFGKTGKRVGRTSNAGDQIGYRSSFGFFYFYCFFPFLFSFDFSICFTNCLLELF